MGTTATKPKKSTRKPEQNLGGRPTVVTEAVVQKLEQAFAFDATVEEACFYAGIARNTFYEYLKKNPEFQDRIDELRQTPILAARKRIVEGVTENYHNAMDYMKRKRKGEFGDNVDVTSGGKTIGEILDEIEEEKQAKRKK